MPGAVETGLRRGEVVIRGGQLDKPCIISCKPHESGLDFWKLERESVELCKFLCGKTQWTHPSAKVDVLTQTQELVYERCVDMIRKAMAVGNDDADVD